MNKKKIIIICLFVVLITIAAIALTLNLSNKRITIRFVDKGEVIKEIKAEKGEIIKLPTPTKDEYIFDGWYYKDKLLNNSALFDKDVTLKATWSEKGPEMIITYNLGDDEEEIQISTSCKNPLALLNPNKQGYKFISWQDELGNEVTSETTLPCKDITLIAKWEKVDGTTEKVDSKSENLEEALSNISVKKAFDDYKPDNDAITIYLFYGNECIHCHHFLEFLNSITNEYGKYFNLKAYEVWHNEANSKLLTEATTIFNEKSAAVPYIIIGNKTFKGYSESSNKDIKKAITDLYETNKNERYDILKEIIKSS